MPGWLQGLLFFLTVFVIWGGAHIYLFFRTRQVLGIGRRGRPWLVAGLAFLASAYFVGRLVELGVGRLVALPLYWPGGIWMGYVGVLGSLLIWYEIGIALPLWLTRRLGGTIPAWAQACRVWGLRGAYGLAILGVAFGMARTFTGPALNTHEVRLPGLPKSMDGFSLVLASDIHLGELIGPWYLARIERVFREADGDLVVLTGDLSDEDDGGDGSGLRRLAQLPSRRGVLVVTGNHERYSGGESLVRVMRDVGMEVLRQEHRVIEPGLVIAGIDDPAFLDGGRRGMPNAMAKAVQDAPDGLPIVLLSHQPLAMEAASTLGVDLMLCGHTHGGQTPPFGTLNGLVYPVVSGWANYGPMKLFVNNGAGWWGPPVRVFAGSEVVKFVLRSTEAEAGESPVNAP